jgi:ABC-type antimicrobial peptide transport system permease subunit
MNYNRDGKKEIEVSAKVGDANFIPTYELKITAGRNYYPSDTLKELVINHSLVKAMGFKHDAEAIGQLLNFNGKDYPVVGVVADFHENSLHQQIKPTFIAYFPNMAGNLGVKLNAAGKNMGEVKATLAKIQSTYKEIYPDDKLDCAFLDDVIDRLYSREQKLSTLVNTAAAIAVLISCLGLLGLATFTAEQRTKEIGVRKVLGASISSIVMMLSRDFVLLVGIAILIGSPVAWWGLRKWLNNFAYRVDLEWWVFALAGLMALGIALITVSFQSLKAAVRNPVESLRGE